MKVIKSIHGDSKTIWWLYKKYGGLKYKFKSELREIMKTVNLDEITSKCIRIRLEEELNQKLDSLKAFIDEEILLILGNLYFSPFSFHFPLPFSTFFFPLSLSSFLPLFSSWSLISSPPRGGEKNFKTPVFLFPIRICNLWNLKYNILLRV